VHQVPCFVRPTIAASVPRERIHFFHRSSADEDRPQVALLPGSDQSGEVVDVYIKARRDEVYVDQ
jgi:hypothetical protein